MPMNRSCVNAAGKRVRVAVNITEPWAYADGLCLDGLEVRAMRGYSRWCGRELYWFHIDEPDLPEALAQGRIDVAIGGLCAAPDLARCARLVRFGRNSLAPGVYGHSAPRPHVWAIRRSALSVWAGVSVYLKLRERAELLSLRRAGGTRPAFDRTGLPENGP
jgi:hypothetical protein